MSDPTLPDPVPSPADLAEYAAVKLAAVEAALACGNGAEAERHLRELGAEGSGQVARGFTEGLVQAGMMSLADRTPLDHEAGEHARARFLAAAKARPRMLPDPQWSAGHERRYLLYRAVLFQAYVVAGTWDDEQTREMIKLADAIALSALIAFDLDHDTHLGPYRAVDERWLLDPAAYVDQERAAAETY